MRLRCAFPLALLLFTAGAAAIPSATSAPSAVRSTGDFRRLLGDLEREEQSLKKRVSELTDEAKILEQRSVANGRAYVRWTRAGLMPIGHGFAALVDHAARLERVHRALERDQARERELHRERVRFSQKLSELNVRRAPLELQGRALAQAEAALLSEQDRELAFQRAFSSSAPTGHTAVYGAGAGPDDAADPKGFAALKGRLPFPITGRSEIRSARRVGSEGPGLELVAPTGSPVRAVCGGRVAFADAYADYGKTVILDHGDKHYTVSANLERIDVHVGDEISAGAPLGSVGQSPTGPKLYFEIRAGNQVVDPAEWFGI